MRDFFKKESVSDITEERHQEGGEDGHQGEWEENEGEPGEENKTKQWRKLPAVTKKFVITVNSKKWKRIASRSIPEQDTEPQNSS